MQGYNVKYRVIGKVLDAKIAKKLVRFPNTELINAMPFVELIDEYRNADLYVLISKRETFGLCYPEAMSQGLPIIYSKDERFDGFFKDGVVGYAVSYQSQNELLQAIKKVIANYSTLTKNSIKYANNFNWDDISRVWVNMCKEVCHIK